MPASSRSGRYRADLIDVGWAPEHSYGANPPTAELGANDVGTANTAMYRQWGIVNGGINLPNPTFAWTPFYGLGVDDRNMLFPIQGQETLEGGMPGAMLCHDSSRLAFEQMYGLIYNAMNTALGTPLVASTGGTGWSACTTTVAHDQITLASGTGDSSIDFTTMGPSNSTTQASPPTHIIMVGNPGETPNPWDCTWAYIGGTAATSIAKVFQDRSLAVAGWNGKRPASGAAVKYAVHSIERITGAGVVADGVLRGTASTLKTVNVRPTLIQSSFMLGAKFRSDDGSNFVTNYKGCKVSRFTISLEEGSPVTYNYDFIAQDMRHNIGEDAAAADRDTETARYADLGTAAANTVDVQPMRVSRVVEQPYFFTGAEVTFHGQPFARLRSLTINVDNALDPRYYVTQSAAATATHNDRQVLYEILEGRRTITLSGSVDLDDTGSTQVGGTGTIVTDAKFLQYVLNQGMMDADQRDMQTLKGISVEVELRKIYDASNGSATHDVIKLQLPDPGKVTNNEGSTSGVGLFLNSAGIGVPAPPSVHVPQDFDGQASSLAIQFLDRSAS